MFSSLQHCQYSGITLKIAKLSELQDKTFLQSIESRYKQQQFACITIYSAGIFAKASRSN